MTKNSTSNGWIKLHRKIRDHWLYRINRKFSKYEAWLDLVLDANHESSEVPIGNMIVSVPRGSTLTSVKKLAARWGWSRHKTEKFLNCLKTDTMIEHKKDTRFTLITISNYEIYQSPPKQKGHKKDTKKDIKRTSTGHKQEEIKNVKKYSSASAEYRLASLLLEEITRRKPDFKKPNLRAWAEHIDYMIRIDNRNPDRIREVISWCQADSPKREGGFAWQDNILSTAKLREKFDRLELAMTKDPGRSEPRTVKFADAGPSIEFLRRQLDDLLQIPQEQRTAKDREEISRLQSLCQAADSHGGMSA